MGRAYLALYSLVAFATLGWMIWAFYHAPFVNLSYAVALRPVPLIVMPFALVLIVCALATPNPTLVGRERLLKSADPARGILRITRHPLMWGFALWALSHIVARGDAAAAIFFGTFVVLAVSGTWLIDRRKAATLGEIGVALPRSRRTCRSRQSPLAATGFASAKSAGGKLRWDSSCMQSCSCFITASSARTRSSEPGAAPAPAVRLK